MAVVITKRSFIFISSSNGNECPQENEYYQGCGPDDDPGGSTFRQFLSGKFHWDGCWGGNINRSRCRSLKKYTVVTVLYVSIGNWRKGLGWYCNTKDAQDKQENHRNKK